MFDHRSTISIDRITRDNSVSAICNWMPGCKRLAIAASLSLEHKFSRKLNLARRIERRRAAHRAEVPVGGVSLRRIGQIIRTNFGIWIARARMVEEIDRLRAELELGTIRDGKRLREREADIAISRAVQWIAVRGSEGISLRYGKRRGVDAGRSVSTDVVLQTAIRLWRVEPVWPLRMAPGLANIGAVEVEIHIVRLATLKRDNSVCLPSAHSLPHQQVLTPKRG